ncbi:MAG TPA: flagellar hook-associated protein FlgK [Gaiellaceae bacterium]|nr:flagellar hook-associated protein FlgK [Gaiellaceae bacterium]
MGISTFLGLETTLRGLLAQQQEIDVTGHNIANADTPGYSRETANLVASTPQPVVPSGLLGTGVTVQGYQRVRDNFIDIQLRAQTMKKGYAEAQQNGLNQVEMSLNEPSDTGLSSLLSSYWAAWQNVTNAPEDLASRQALAQSAASLANGFNSLASQFQTVVSQTQQQQTLTVSQINSIGTQIAQLNGAIASAESTGQQPNDLLDQRDLLIDQLSELGNTAVSQTAGTAGQYGSLDITVGGATLVTGTTASSLTLASMTSLTSGQLAGMQSVIDSIQDPTTGYLTKLNQLAGTIASATNTQHALGTDLNGNAGGAFFDVTAGNEAATLAVDPAILASPALIAASGNGQVGDASNATAIADLQQQTLLGGATIDTAYSQLVTQIGADSQEAQQNLSNQTSLVDALSNQRQSVSGVSLDEEMSNLLQYQRGYQASARALTAMDQLIDQLVNRTGTVGL